MADLIEAMARAMSRRIMLEEAGIPIEQTLEAMIAVDRAVDEHWTQCEKEARAALAAIDAAGWAMVPKMPTEAMLRCGHANWFALLNAAPKVTP